MRFFLFVFLGLASLVSHAASSFQLLTPRYISVPGGESQDVSIRYFLANGQPAAGESVTITNDACGNFSNGQLATTLKADANGVVTTRFTAWNPPGITCWIRASAGVTATIDVLTYRVSEVRLDVTTDPLQPRLGKPYTVRVTPMWGAYPVSNVDVTARVVNGTITASVAPASINSGDGGTVTFQVTPADAVGDYGLELAYRTQKKVIAVVAPANPWQDMWWSGALENGWGMSIVQHRDQLFSVIYAYDAAGKPTWFVVPGGTWNAARTEFTANVYVPTGSPFYAYDASRFVVGPPVGSVKLTFLGASRATLEYTISGLRGYKEIERNEFGPDDAAPMAGLGDMWWGGAAQDGWGIALLQQGKGVFAVWFTYDAAGAPTWYVMPAGAWTATDTFAGRMYRATAAAWVGVNYDASKFRTTDVGSFRFKFGADGAAFDYTVDNRSGTIALTRTPF